MSWSRAFEDPIPLPRGRQLLTLKDAAAYIMKLPKAEQDLPEWQAATEALIMAAEDRRSLDARSCRNDAGPARRKANSGVRFIEGKTLGTAEAEAGRMTESAGPRFGGESSRKIIEVRRQSKLIINPFP
jgi:hypothetical protein